MKVGWPCSNKVYVQTCHRPQTSYSQSQQPHQHAPTEPKFKGRGIARYTNTSTNTNSEQDHPYSPHVANLTFSWREIDSVTTIHIAYAKVMHFSISSRNTEISHISELCSSAIQKLCQRNCRGWSAFALWAVTVIHYEASPHLQITWPHCTVLREVWKGVSTIWWLKGEPYNSVVYILILVALSSLTLVFRFSVYFSCRKTYSLHVLCYCVMCVFPLIDLIRYVNFATKWAKWHLLIHDHET